MASHAEESLVSLDSYDPSLKIYLLKYNIPTVLESILTGLMVMTPEKPWQYTLRCLTKVYKDKTMIISRDSFVSKRRRPPLTRQYGYLNLEELDLPPQEVLKKVIEFRTKSLLRMGFKAWKLYSDEEKKAKIQLQKRLVAAKKHHKLKAWALVYYPWKTKNRLNASKKLIKVCNNYMMRTLFYAWLEDFIETRKARHWSKSEGAMTKNETDDTWYWPEGEDPISLLPEKVQIKVFSQVGLQGLCRSAQVCRSWMEITKEPRLWNKVNFNPICHLVTDEAMQKVIHKYRPLVCNLNLNGCNRLSSDILRTLGLCQNLQDINLAGVKAINEEVIHFLGLSCANLFYLNLSECYISDSIMLLLTKHYTNLHYLSLARCLQFTSKGLHSITTGKGCRRLLYLDLSGCTQLTVEGFGYIAKGCSILNTLLLDDIPDLADSMILKLASHCKTLRHISIMGGSKLTDKAFILLAMENRRLRCIKIEKNHCITDATLRIIGMKCRELDQLYIAGCSRISDNGLKALTRLKKLQVLNLADCGRISDFGIRHVVESEYRERLKELNLTNLNKISDVTLLRIAQNCCSLTCVSFCYCEHISDSGVELLGRIPSLSSLDLSGCSIQDEGVQSLRNNPQFKFIMLAELTEITDDGLQRMCSGLLNIDTLDLSYCEQISDEGIEQLTFYCRITRVLFLANCHKLTDASTKCIAKGCPYLVRLDMSGCSITDRSLVSLRKSKLHLQRLDVLSCAGVTREAVSKLQRTGVQVNYNTEQLKYLSHSDGNLPNVPLVSLIDRL